MNKNLTVCFGDTIEVADSIGGDISLIVREDGDYRVTLYLTPEQSRKFRKTLKAAERAALA